MRIVERAVCLGLAVSCAFFTGCNSIIYNGDFRFKSFEPETVPAVENAVTDKVDETVQRSDTEKYSVEGTDAFYILPNHENGPSKILDFKVLDYTDEGRFVYAYLTPYYGSSDDGLDGMAKTGTAPEENRCEDYSGKTTQTNVLVLMSYDPQTRAYTVFYSHSSAADTADTAVNTQAQGDVGTLTASATNSTVMANRLVKEHRYFIFDENTAYLYDVSGTEVLHNNYSVVIGQETERLKEQALKAGATAAQVQNATVSVSDVVMDGYYYVYIPLTLELGEDDGSSASSGGSDSLDIEEAVLDRTVFTSVASCYSLDIGGLNGVTFYSTNNTWEEQKAYWAGLHTDSGLGAQLTDGSGIFKNAEAVEEYQDAYSMDNIKKTYVEDSFQPFHTEGNSLNMELAWVPNIFSSLLWMISRADNSYQGNLDYNLSYMLNRAMLGNIGLTDSESSAIRQFYWSTLGSGGEYSFWYHTGSADDREKLLQALMKILALEAQGYDTGAARQSCYFMIPWFRPQTWDGRQNALPLLNNSAYALEALYAYKTSVYSTNGGYQQVSRYAPLSFKDRLADPANKPQFDLQVTARSAEGEAERTFRYWAVDENGEDYIEEETETLGSYPLTYSLMLPDNTSVTWLESYNTPELVAASGGLGVIYYSEVTDHNNEIGGQSQSYSSIRYNKGNRTDSLSHSDVKGVAMDAGVLYYEGSETTVLVTDEGMQFYRRGSSGYDSGTSQWVPMENLEQASAGYGLSLYNAETQTSQSTDSRLQVSADSEQIIRKNSESGVAADTYIAANMSLLNEHDVVVSSLSGGIILVNTDNGLTICLKDGAYFAAYPYTASGRRQFMIVGYDTQQYAYQPGDIARAKCYSVDLEAENSRLENEAVQQHLKGLANDCLSRTHRLTREDNGTWSIVTPTAEEETADGRAKRLFFGSEAESQAELSAVAQELGITSVSDATRQYAQSLREQMTAQRKAVQEFYQLAGLGVRTVPAEEAWLLEYEGQLITAMNVSALEDFLVELRLSDTAVSLITDAEKKAQYTSYQKELQAAVLTNNAGTASVPETGSSQKTENQYGGLRQEYEAGSAERKSAIEASAFYESVLADVKTAWQTGAGADADWDSYLLDLLKRISPDNAVTQQERGLTEFYELTGIPKDVAESQKLPERIQEFRRVRELEELIVEYKLSTAEYRNSAMKAEFASYQEGLYETEDDKTRAFQAGSFYQIIEDLKTADAGKLEGTTWNQELREVLGMCTQGIVLMENQ